MSRQSARRPKKASGLERYAGAAAQRAGAFVSENPALVGGTTAFAVTMFFVASNALWYQPNAHRDAFFETRSLESYKAPVLPQKQARLNSTKSGKEDLFRIVQEDALPPDPVVRDIQSALREMAMYEGTVDGIAGPRTLAAIREFQQRAGLEPNGKVGEPLLDAIRTASVPVPKAKKLVVTAPDDAEPAELGAKQISQIQSALKKHGYDEVEPDGIVGSKTSDAIKAFQIKHKLKVTARADETLLRAMVKAGWVKG
jgi:peptidoglycan hydrolase-like protein with peptidoglycan-binding domain